MKFNKNLTARIATIKAPINPTAKTEYSEDVKEKLLLTMSRADAANIVGMANKKENSTAAFLFVPRRRAGMIVAADLETPGITDTDWKTPIRNAFL